MYVTHLECSATGEQHPADRPHNLSRAGKPLLVRYDLEAATRIHPSETQYSSTLVFSCPLNRIPTPRLNTSWSK